MYETYSDGRTRTHRSKLVAYLRFAFEVIRGSRSVQVVSRVWAINTGSIRIPRRDIIANYERERF